MDSRSLQEQLKALHRDSFAWAMCCAGDRAEAEDVLQCVYLKIVQGRARFGGQSSLKTWLFSVIRRTAAGRRRWRWARELKKSAVQSLLLSQRRGEEEPGTILAGRELADRLEAALAKLPDRQRQALQLTFYDGLTLSEAAKVMAISIGSARTHYQRGKRALRQKLLSERTDDERQTRQLQLARSVRATSGQFTRASALL